jgi:CRP-like cAMP-binding protein
MSSPVLSRIGILSYLDDEARQQLAGYGHVTTIEPGQVLISEGNVNRRLYVILSGIFAVATKALGSEVQLDTVGPGDCLGEVAIFHPDQASATVTCREAGEIWSIDATQLQEFLTASPEYGCALILGINIILSRRLKRANEVIRFHQIVPVFLTVRTSRRPVTAKIPPVGNKRTDK